MSREFYRQLAGLGGDTENLVVTVLDGPHAGAKAVLQNGKVVFAEGMFRREYARQLSEIRATGITQAGGTRLFAQIVTREARLVICGAGNVGLSLIRIAKLTGFYVICIDDREEFARKAREAGADESIRADFQEALRGIRGDAGTYFVVVTRGHQYDLDCLRTILRLPRAYAGMMGSRRRTVIMKQQLLQEGIPAKDLDGLHAPIGLPIGSQTPEEIAVSILAEIIARKNKTAPDTPLPRKLLDELQNPEVPAILATIIARSGSAPREVGTKMLIRADGTLEGTIGGGLSEAEVIRAGREMLCREDKPDLRPVVIHVTFQDDPSVTDGMLCGGAQDVMMEYILPENER